MKKFTNLIFTSVIFFSLSSLSLDDKKCSKMLNDGWLKKYKFGGIGDSYWDAVTKESKAEGSVTGTSNISTEATTALSDPGYYSNVFTSETQSTSSWGECSLASLKKRQDQQIAYVEQNLITIERQIALGFGEHLDSLADFNFCNHESIPLFKKILKNNFNSIQNAGSSKDKVKEIKAVLSRNSNLNQICHTNYIETI